MGQAELIESLLEEGLAVTNGLILSEILQGFRRTEERNQMEKRFKEIPCLIMNQSDFIQVGHLSAILRRKGQTTSLIDLLIAQSSISNNLPLLHFDSDYQRIAKIAPLKIHPQSLK